MRRPLGYLALVLAALTALSAAVLRTTAAIEGVRVDGVALAPLVVRGLFALALLLGSFGVYVLVTRR